MKLPAVRLPGLRRRPVDQQPVAHADGAHPLERPEQPERSGRPVGKGRPTPKRSEAQRRRRGPAHAPANRKEAARLNRDEARAKRQRAREGLRRGDERYLPARDAGPVRRLVRDVVDSRRNALSLFLIAAVVLFVGTLVRVPFVQTASVALWFIMVIIMVADSVWLGLLVRRTARTRFPEYDGRMGGLVFYSITRASQMRRLRVPPPKVSVGQRP